jgi:uncharacterized membrane protein YqjE
MDPESSTEGSDVSSPNPSEHMTHALSGFIAARVELASIEAKEAASFTGKKFAQGLMLAISAFFLWSLVLAGATGIVAPHADRWLHDKADWLPGWAAVVLALALIHGIIVLACYLKLKKQPTTPLFELSRKEIENDKLWLTKNK